MASVSDQVFDLNLKCSVSKLNKREREGFSAKDTVEKCVCSNECNEACLSVQNLTECTDCDVGLNCGNRGLQLLAHVAKLVPFETKRMGKGVLTIASIPNDELICAYFGEIISHSEQKKRYIKNGEPLPMVFGYEFTNLEFAGNFKYCIDGKNLCNIGPLVNHSCEPNAYFVEAFVNNEPRVGIKALRDIRASEEITVNYGKGYAPITAMQCLCLTEKCTGFLFKGKLPDKDVIEFKRKKDKLLYEDLYELKAAFIRRDCELESLKVALYDSQQNDTDSGDETQKVELIEFREIIIDLSDDVMSQVINKYAITNEGLRSRIIAAVDFIDNISRTDISNGQLICKLCGLSFSVKVLKQNDSVKIHDVLRHLATYHVLVAKALQPCLTQDVEQIMLNKYLNFDLL